MQFTLENNAGLNQINAYETGCIKINNLEYKNSLIIAPLEIIDNWPPQSLNELNAQHLNRLLELSVIPEVVLLGTGSRLVFPNPAFLSTLYNRQIGIEVMDTFAACRTYNVLMSEGRKVAAALLIS